MGHSVECPACGHHSSCIFRCDECGHDLVGVEETAGDRAAIGGGQ
ncbi:hypothetical protein [Haloarcula sp. S1AR25-4]|nr:hypothetical protein [Halomicroarcula sp. S1AR25-4]